MKIYTENQLKEIVCGVLGTAHWQVSRPLYREGEVSLAQIEKIIAEINGQYGLHVTVEDPASVTVNDLIEKMNGEIGVNDIVIRTFFLDICQEHLGECAIRFDGRSYTYDELLDAVERCAAGLHALGVRKSGKVALILSNRMEYIVAYFALFYLGAHPVPINTRWGRQEVFNVLEDAGAEVIVTEEKIGGLSYGAYVEEYLENHTDVRWVVHFAENHYGAWGVSYDALMNPREKLVEVEKIFPDDVAMLSYTSGTTGTPKGVMLKQNDIVKISAYTTQTWRTEKEEYPFSIAPLYSAQGFLSLFIDFALGKTFKMSSTFRPNDILKEISKCENTVVHTQPTMWSLLLNCRIINFTRFDSLKKLVVSGSLCSPELARRIEEKLGCVLLNAYGLIEGTSVVTMTRLDDPYEVRMNTVGRAIPGVEIKIVDENRNEAPWGEVGELAVRGYTMAGYYNNPEKTAEVLTEDGWLYTGDLARYYDEENICIVGRCKDMIIRGGFNVYPSDIEEYLLQIDGVQNAAVVGRPSEILGEEIVAFVLPQAGRTLTKNEVIRGLFKKLANYKMPDQVYFVSEIPTILAGKIDKKELRLWAERGIPSEKQVLFGGDRAVEKE